MSAKTANVTARIQPEIKEQAEAILSQNYKKNVQRYSENIAIVRISC